MKKGSIRTYLAGVLTCALALGSGASALAAYQRQAVLDYTGIQITLNGQAVTPTDANGSAVEPFAIDGTTYLPVRGVANALGLGVEWEQATQTVKLTGGGANPTGAEIPTGTYSRTNPAPIGTAQSIRVKNILEEYNASAVVLEATRGAAAMKILKEADQFSSEPQAGMEYVLVKLRTSINSVAEDKSVSLSKLSFDCYSSDNVEYGYAWAVAPKPEFSGSVFAGGTLEGYAVYQVSVSDPSPKLVFGANYDGSGGVWFSLA